MAGTDRKYLLRAYEEAALSPDPSTQNGAVVVGKQGGFVVACNGFPRGVAVLDERLVRPLKYEYVEHAERNVIYACARYGYCTEGATMYVPWFACSECARATIQAGIAEVVGHRRMADETPERWRESIAIAMSMLEEAGVRTRLMSGVLGGPRIRFNGEWWEP